MALDIRKVLIIWFLTQAAMFSVYAEDLKFLDSLKEDTSVYIEDVDLYPELVFGLAPLYVRGGVNYSGFEVLEEQQTNVFLIGGGSVMGVEPWTDESGSPSEEDNSYSKIQYDISAMLKQGLMERTGGTQENPLLSLYGRYDFHWTDPMEDLFDGAEASSFLSGDSSAYPDNSGTLTNVLRAGVLFELVDETDIISGLIIEASLLWAPQWFFNTYRGLSNFYNIVFSLEAYKGLLEIKREGDLTNFGLYIANRVRADYIGGEAVPHYYQKESSLGTKMRGYEDYSMGTAITIVNNLELRLCGSEVIENINPVFNLFIDTGFFYGNYYNTVFCQAADFRLSTGFEAAINLFDYMQIGISLGFPLVGKNLQEKTMLPDLMLTYKF